MTSDLLAQLERDRLSYHVQALLLRQHYRRVLPRLVHPNNAAMPAAVRRAFHLQSPFETQLSIVERISHEQQ